MLDYVVGETLDLLADRLSIADSRLAATERTLPCGHHHSLEDSYGGCVLCVTIKSHTALEDELAASEANLARLQERWSTRPVTDELQLRLAAAYAWRTRAEALLLGLIEYIEQDSETPNELLIPARALLDPRTPDGDDEGSRKLMRNAGDAI